MNNSFFKTHGEIIFAVVVIASIFSIVFMMLLPKKSIPDYSVKGVSSEIQSESEAFSHNLATIKSNQWYSSIYSSFPSKPFYAFPLAFQLTQSGLGFSFPHKNTTSKTIFALYNEDITVGTDDQYNDAELSGVYDFSIGINLKSKTNTLSFHIAKGMPYTTITSDKNPITIYIKSDATFFDINGKDLENTTKLPSTFIIQTHDNYYFVSFDTTSAINSSAKKINSQTKSVFIALLDKKENAKIFQEISHSKITSTNVEYSVDTTSVISKFSVSSSQNNSLVALFSHQYDFLTGSLDETGEYETLRGPMQLFKINTFTTQYPTKQISQQYETINFRKDILRNQIKDDVAKVIKEKVPDSKNYFLGTWFGKINNLLLLAESQNLDSEKNQLIEYILPIFTDSLSYYKYDKNQTSTIATKPEFGNEKLNDHHFHYGYFIQLGATIARLKPETRKSFEEKLQPLIDDIATIDRNTDKYPFLRNFDMYEGHSWADGYANFPDGNNQESSSEAINTWYSLYTWSRVTENAELEKYMRALLTTEITSAKYYWFGQKNIYEDYNHPLGSIVWGGKVDYATWFSAETNMIYGIHLLPFSPISSYLGELQNFNQLDDDFKKNKGDPLKEWGNYYLMWKSFYDPNYSLTKLDEVKKYDDPAPPSLVMYFIFHNVEK